ncbi:MAG TPA: universal stress protein [Streptosporangiaceae bacterium]|nr:universal stress protein [Streptosporangiaceae bacterium]
MSLLRRVLVGTCGSPGSIRALRYARDLAVSSAAALVPVHAWLPPGGDMADRRAPNPILRKLWQDNAQQRLQGSIEAAFGGPPDDVDIWPVIMRGPTGEVLVQLASRPDDLLVVGAGKRGMTQNRPRQGCPLLRCPCYVPGARRAAVAARQLCEAMAAGACVPSSWVDRG